MNFPRFKLIMVSVILWASSLSHADIYIGAKGGSSIYPGFSDSSTSIELSAGYRFSKYLAMEFGWTDFGETSLQSARRNQDYLRVEGTGSALIAFLPLTEHFEVFWKLGLYSWGIESSSITAKAAFRSKSQGADLDFLVGYGMNWYLSDNFAMSAQYQELDVQGDNIGNQSLGLIYSF